MVSVTISAAGRSSLLKGLPTTLEIAGDASTVTVGQVKAALAAKFPKLYVERQKLSLKDDKKALDNDATLAGAGVADGAAPELAVKDLGPQISWRTVFLIEYVGPLVIHPLFFHLPRLFYGGAVQHSMVQKYAYAMVLAHYVKRELETVFVHRFSKSTMPLRNIFKNSFHYHVFGGLFLAYALYGPALAAHSSFVRNTIRDDPTFLLSCAAFWTFCELSNFKTHLTTSGLRPAGTRTRAIPRGYGFDLVSFPNYLFESLCWVTVSLMTGNWAAWFFTVVSTGQMLIWAQKKHRNYKREFGKDFPRGRKAMVPFIF